MSSHPRSRICARLAAAAITRRASSPRPSTSGVRGSSPLTTAFPGFRTPTRAILCRSRATACTRATFPARGPTGSGLIRPRSVRVMWSPSLGCSLGCIQTPVLALPKPIMPRAPKRVFPTLSRPTIATSTATGSGPRLGKFSSGGPRIGLLFTMVPWVAPFFSL